MAEFKTVVIVGVGLIGGSVGLTLRTRRLAQRVVGIGRDPSRLDDARRLGAIDDCATDWAEVKGRVDVAVVCTPVSRIAGDVIRASEHADGAFLVTDAGSTKRTIVETVEAATTAARTAFVGAHPIAGSERQGAQHADAHLFGGRPCVLTPTPRTDPARLEQARRFWSSLGCSLIEMSAENHDRALALTSHLPHAVASALANSIPAELLGLAGGAFRDGARVAASDPDLWTNIFSANRDHLVDAIGAFQTQLADLKTWLATDNQAAIRAWCETAKTRRLAFSRREASAVDSRGSNKN